MSVKTQRTPSARELALDILTRVEQERAYSNLLLNQTLHKYKPEKVESALMTEIVYGTIQRRNTIDFFLREFVNKGLNKLEPWVRNLLRLSFYQLYYLHRIPPHAIVNEAVNLAKRKGHAGISGMVNGVLRNVIRHKDRLVIPSGLDPVRRISLAHSHPEWMVARWVGRFGEAEAERICAANNDVPHSSVRVNRMRAGRDEMAETMRQAGLHAEPSALAASGIVVEGGGNMALTEWFRTGDISIQDESSMLVAQIGAPEPGMRVLDCCAAPGGKTTALAERMGDQGTVWAADIHEHKRALIEEQANRLKLASIHAIVQDARRLPERFADGSFDFILLDAPCSGLGVIRRKPDIKWSKQEEELAVIQELQFELLSAAQQLLRPGGTLLYSTCTIEYGENEGMIEKFLAAYPQFETDAEAVGAVPPHIRDEIAVKPGLFRILPHAFGTDGFFIAKLLKRI